MEQHITAIILCACVSLAKCGAKIGPTTTTTDVLGSEYQQPASTNYGVRDSPVIRPVINVGPTATAGASGFGFEPQQSPSINFGNIVSPAGGPFGQTPIIILPANFLSTYNQASINQPLGHFQPILNQPVVTLHESPSTGQVPQADDNSPPAPSYGARTSATAASSALATVEPAPVQIAASAANQVLGILQPSHPPAQSSDILSQLLPEFIEITNKLEARGIKGSGRTQAEEIVKSFMPLMRKVMINNAEAEGRSLTSQEVDAINFAEKTVGPFVAFGYDVSDNGKGFNNPTLPKNDVPNDFFAQMMIDLLPDLTRIVKQIKYQHGGWPGTGSAVEVMDLFIPFARRVVESQARIEGRFITREEHDYLRFGEDVVPILMKYAQESFNTGKSSEAAEKYNIVDVVQNALSKLHKGPSYKPKTRNSYQPKTPAPHHPLHPKTAAPHRPHQQKTPTLHQPHQQKTPTLHHPHQQKTPTLHHPHQQKTPTLHRPNQYPAAK